MPTLHSISVKHIDRNTPDSVILTLDIPEGVRDEFSFKAGQYLTFAKIFDGEELRRSYSICVGEGSDTLCVGIKKIENGAFSSFANEKLVVGDELLVLPPQGKFVLKEDRAEQILLIAAGSGITPIISHAETILAANEYSQITLIYGNKSPNSIMFKERLEELKNLYIERLNIIHIFSQTAQDIDLFSGRIDGKRCLDILTKWCKKTIFDQVFICGPEPMIKNVRVSLEALGIDKSRINYELFATVARKRSPAQVSKKHDEKKSLTVVLDGTSFQLDLLDGEAVLDAARRQNIDAPYSCRGGICSTCRCKILKGRGQMNVNHVLEDYEVEQGYALSCQLTADSKEITISYDEGH